VHSDATANAKRMSWFSTGLAPVEPTRLRKLHHDQLRIVLRNIAPSVVAMPIFALVISFVLAKWVTITALGLWVAAVIVTVGCLHVIHLAVERTAEKIEDTPRHLWTATLICAVFGVVWTAPGLLFWEHLGLEGHFLLTLVFACSIAGASALQSPCPPLFVGMTVPYAIGLVVPPLLEGKPFYLALALLALCFCLYMLHLARQVYVTTLSMLMLREDKNDLIEQLTAAKIESDKARQRAEAASQAKSEFLANMSHELRTPLNAILGFSEVMKDEVFGNLGKPQYIDYANHIHNSGHHLLGLINDVLDLSRIEAGRFVVRAEEIDVPSVIKTALAMFEVRAAQGSIQLKRDMGENLPLLLADDRAFRQILLNLISNAVKFTRAGGSVTVFARRTAGGGMDIGVIDTGVGIDPADVATVFEAFGQGQHDIAVRERGTGLGLPIVRGLIEAHGGKVKLDSVLGKGTTVTCTFPRERLTAPQPVPIRLATVL
jgi:two-component system cell cycle sensor histidine kinase PleC